MDILQCFISLCMVILRSLNLFNQWVKTTKKTGLTDKTKHILHKKQNVFIEYIFLSYFKTQQIEGW